MRKNFTDTANHGAFYGVPNSIPVVPVQLDYSYNSDGDLAATQASIARAADPTNFAADYRNSFAYDELGRMTRLVQSGTAAAGQPTLNRKVVDMTYNMAGQFDSITRSAGDVGSELAVAAGDYSYFDGGGLQSVSYTHQTSPLSSYAWTYDDAGRVTTFAAPEGTVSYGYDNTHQLVSTTFNVTPGYTGPTPGSEAFQYDATGNRTGNGEVVDNNQLLDDSNSEYYYDSEGNTVAKKLKSDGSWELSYWDHRYRLVRMEYKDAYNVLQKAVTYSYDVYDRRVMKRVDSNPSDGQNAYETTERFVWDGNEVSLVLDENGTIEHRFLHGPLIDQVFADETTALVEGLPTPTLLWYLTDNQHTVRDVLTIDSTGQPDVVNHLTYSAFGQIVGETDPDTLADASAHTPIFAYTGREWDEDIQLQYNRARWYDPGTGRWYSEDPLRWLAGDTNLYRYVGNNPTNAVDPSGLEDIGKGHHWVPQSVLNSLRGFFSRA